MAKEKKRLRLSDLQNRGEGNRGLACRRCGCRDLHVVYTRAVRSSQVRRRRECRNCGYRFTTHERAI